MKLTRAMIIAATAATVMGIIRDKFFAGFTREETYNSLRPLVASQTRPFVFEQNAPGGRIPKPMDVQYTMLRDSIGRIYSALERDPAESGDNGDDDSTPEPDAIVPEPEPTSEETPDSEKRPVKKNQESDLEKAERYYSEYLRLREFCERESETEPLDELSYRPLKAGNRLLQVGFPVEGLISQMTLTWPDDAKRRANIRPFDMHRYSREVMASEGITTITRSNGRVETPHSLFGAILTFARAGQSIFLIGPYGTGKSHAAKQVADFMGRTYGEAPMSNGASRGDLLGRHTIGGLSETMATAALAASRTYRDDPSELIAALERIRANGAGGFITSEFESACTNGGFFCFEELDSADAGMLLVVNNAMESDELFNPVNGRVIAKHPDTVFIATGNTPGLGATKNYNTRERLDASTLDRWRMGRFFVTPDAKVERAILFEGLS